MVRTWDLAPAGNLNERAVDVGLQDLPGRRGIRRSREQLQDSLIDRHAVTERVHAVDRVALTGKAEG